MNQNPLENPKRFLQYSLGSIYYETENPINNLTGTGDRLKDVPYKVLCRIKQCESGCCIGEIDNMLCGPADRCALYLEESKFPGLIMGIIIPVVLFIIFVVLFLTFKKNYKMKTCRSVCFALCVLTIILIPYVIYWMYKNGVCDCDEKDNKAKEG